VGMGVDLLTTSKLPGLRDDLMSTVVCAPQQHLRSTASSAQPFSQLFFAVRMLCPSTS
jgi:hypothetical protein